MIELRATPPDAPDALPGRDRLRAGPAGGLIAILVGATAVVVFLPSLKCGFVNWDDNTNFLLNEHYRGLGPRQLAWMWTTCHNGPYQPLSWMSLGFNYLVGGMNPWGYHLVNILLHGMGAALFAALAYRLILARSVHSSVRPPFTAAAAAMLVGLCWAVHPLRVEAVTWVTERREVLCGVLSLAALHAAVSRRGRSSIAIVSALAMLAKGTAVTLAVLLVLIDVYCDLMTREERWTAALGRAVRRHIAVFGIAIAVSLVAIWGQRQVSATVSLGHLGYLERLRMLAYSLGFYACKTVWPAGLAPLYEAPLDRSTLTPFALGSAAGVIAALVAAAVLRRRLPELMLLLVAYVVLVIPVGGLIQVGSQVAADRYSYQPAWALTVLAGGVALLAASRLPRAAASAAVVVASIAAGIGLIPRCMRQQAIWHDTMTLWNHQLALYPDTAIAHFNVGMELINPRPTPQRDVEAGRHFRAAIAKFPRYYVDAYWQLGFLCRRNGRLDEAIRNYEQCLSIDRRYAPALDQLGQLHWLLGKRDKAIEYFRRLVDADPRADDSHLILARALAAAGRPADAIRAYEAGMLVVPGSAALRGELAQLLCTYPDAAIRDGRRALSLAQAARTLPGGEEAQYAIIVAAAHAELGDFDEAEETLRDAAGLAPPGSVEAQAIEQLITQFRARQPLRRLPAFEAGG